MIKPVFIGIIIAVCLSSLLLILSNSAGILQPDIITGSSVSSDQLASKMLAPFFISLALLAIFLLYYRKKISEEMKLINSFKNHTLQRKS